MNLLQDINPIFTIAAFAVLVLADLTLLFGLFVKIHGAIWWLRDRIQSRKPWIKKQAVSQMNEASDSTAENSPSMPDSLKHLRVEKLSAWGEFILHGFHADLTIAQGVLFDDPKEIAWVCDFYDRAGQHLSHYVIEAEPRPPVRLHSENVLLLRGSSSEVAVSKDHESLSKWLMKFDWSPDRSFCFQEATTARPVEDGFVRCVRIIVVGEKQSSSEDDRLHWTASEPLLSSLFDTFSKFMHDESERVKRSFSCEQWLHDWYKASPQEEKTHPGFAILQQFDDGITRIEFAGSVVSPTELRFWSRVACYHK